MVSRFTPIMQQRDDDTVELEGTIHTVLPGTMFRVELDNGHLVLAHISGKMRKRFIRLVAGDRVKIEIVSLRHGESPHRLPCRQPQPASDEPR